MTLARVIELDGPDLPDGQPLGAAVSEFWCSIDRWTREAVVDPSWHWSCPAYWRRAAERDFLMRGVRLASLARVLDTARETSIEIRSADPLLARLAQGIASERGLHAVRVTRLCGPVARLASRLEPLAMAAWWCISLAVRGLFRRVSPLERAVGTLVLEPCVAGTPDPSAHNWGSSDPAAGIDRVRRLQIPIGFGLRFRRVRRSIRSIRGAMLAEDVMDATAWRSVLASPWRAMRSWPTSGRIGTTDLGLWSTAMKRRLVWSTTLQAAAMVDGAIDSMSRRGVSIERAMGWFENQPQERAFVLAMRRNWPRIRIVGFLQYHFSRLSHAGIIPTIEQVRAGTVPDEIVCTGRVQVDWLRSECPWQEFSVMSRGRLSVPDLVLDPTKRSVLVIAPSCDRSASRMFEVAAAAAAELGESWTVRLRPHPANRERWTEHGVPQGVAFDRSQSLASAIRESSVVVGGGGSGIVIARAAGWPVVVLTPRGEIEGDPFPPGHDLDGIRHATDARGLARTILESSSAQPPGRAHGLFA